MGAYAWHTYNENLGKDIRETPIKVLECLKSRLQIEAHKVEVIHNKKEEILTR